MKAAAIPAFLLPKIIAKHLENLVLMGASLLIGAMVMGLVDARNQAAEADGRGAAGSITAGGKCGGQGHHFHHPAACYVRNSR